jgi:uncharacterized SAM-binding protein YcdF (DUF218 family)
MFKFLKRLAITLLALCAVLLVCYGLRAPLLRGAANVWIVNDPLSKADAIVVLGGGMETRPFEAARLFHQGLAPRILLTNPRPSPTTQAGLIPTESAIARNILLQKEVPANDIFITAGMVTNTCDEAIAVRDWAKTNHIKRIIIATDSFHTRRARWIFCKELKPLGVRVEMDAVPGRQYTPGDWWRQEEGVVAFQNEVLKYAYYRVKY